MTDTFINSLEEGSFVIVDADGGCIGVSDLKYPNCHEVTEAQLEALEKPLTYYTYKDGQFSLKEDSSKQDYESCVIHRVEEYPTIGDQLDDLFRQGAFSAEMTARLQAVKDKYPKS